MNILFLYRNTIDPILGGVERVTHILASWFATKEYTTYFLGLEKNSSIIDTRQYYLPSSKSFCVAENIQSFLFFLKEHTIDIVINQGGIGPQTSELAYYAHELDVKLISVIHNSLLASIKNFSFAYADRFHRLGINFLLPITDYSLIKNILMTLYKWKYKDHYRALCKNSDLVILLSEKYKEELGFFTKNVISSNIIGLSNPVSFDTYNGEKYLNKKKELLYVGRIDFSQKRVDLLLRIWSKLYQEFPDWSLNIVGGGIQLPEAIQLSSDLKLKNISFKGFQDPRVYFENSSLFCMVSSFEGFPMVLVEAMQYGVIPFTFNSFLSITDIIDDQVNGVLISPFDTDEYISELKRFMRDDDLRSSFSKRSIIKSKDFSIDKIGNKWISLFDRLKTNKWN
jgi:glycosyltransferase involved in cell wall biosynthesis